MKIKNFNKKDLAKLVGLLLTDGSVRYASRTYRIVYAGKSEELHKIFRNLMQSIFDLQNFYERIDNKGVRISEYSSKEAGDFLVNLCNTLRTKSFKTYPVTYPTINLDIFNQLTSDELKEVFRLMFSADGGVVLGAKWHKRFNKWELTRRVILKCSHPNLRKFYRDLLRNKLAINTKEWDASIAIDTKRDLYKFAKEIRFVDKIKASGKSIYWEGYEKNKVLDILLKTYQADPNIWKSFKHQSDVLHFIRRLG